MVLEEQTLLSVEGKGKNLAFYETMGDNNTRTTTKKIGNFLEKNIPDDFSAFRKIKFNHYSNCFVCLSFLYKK